MCGRYIIVEKILDALDRLNVDDLSDYEGETGFKPNYNVGVGQYAPVITNDQPNKLQNFRFGLVPHWSKKKVALFNARAEGDHNKENDPEYKGAKGIINKPSFRKAIRTQRCLVLANAFIEGTTKNGLSEPYLVYVENEPTFCFAGIWDEWTDQSTGEIIKGFAIITTTANDLVQKIQHDRMPVILPKSYERKWLKNEISLSEVTNLLKPFPSEKMNAYPISPEIKNVKNNTRDFIKPVGEKLNQKQDLNLGKTLKLHGMGRHKHNPEKE